MLSDLVDENCAPIAIGGVGGSGTRLIAQLLAELGYYIGSDLNEANDNLWFTLLFKQVNILSASDGDFETLLEIFVKAMQGGSSFTKTQTSIINGLAARDRDQHPASWLKQRVRSLLLRPHSPVLTGPFGWKEPNTHIIMDRLQGSLPTLKYIHVARNGLDMAYSTNQNQLRLWGPHFIGDDFQVSPFFSLKYWCRVHARVLDICRPMGARFLLINFDQFCSDPASGIESLLKFLDHDAPEALINALSKHVKRPASIGRYKEQATNNFDPADLEFVKELGFDTSFN